MRANYSMGYGYGASSSTLPNPHMMSFQSGAMDTSTSLTCNPVGLPSGQPSMVGTSSHVGRTGDPGPSNVLAGPGSGLKWNPGLAQEWTEAEDALLIGGLSKFGNESPLSKYVKIAATLKNKTVRDVALRCQWVNDKRKINRRKPDDHHVKKLRDRKEKVIASQANTNMANMANMAPYNKATYSERTQSKAPVVDCVTQLLDQNNHLIQSILSNSGNRQQVLDPSRSVVFINTDLLPAPEVKDYKPGSNPMEAYVVSEVTRELVKRNICWNEIGIITPYNSQANLIRSVIDASGLVEVHTIDKYQGRDKDCILVSFVRSSRNSRACASSLLGDWHRINVALTRAKVNG